MARRGSFHPVKRPGALTARAKASGQSTMAYARAHYHSKGLVGQQARFAVNAAKFKHHHSKVMAAPGRRTT